MQTKIQKNRKGPKRINKKGPKHIDVMNNAFNGWEASY